MGVAYFYNLLWQQGLIYKLGMLTPEILNDLQFIVRSYKYLNICNPPLKMNG